MAAVRTIIISILLFTLTYLSFSFSRIGVSSDSKWSIYTAASIIHEGNINLNEFKTELNNKSFYGVTKFKGNSYPFFPVGPSILAVPFVFVFENYPNLALKLMPGFRKKEIKRIEAGKINPIDYRVSLEKHIASFILAITTVILFLVISRLSSIQNSLIISVIYAFGTSVWSTASRGLWQHGPSLLMLSLAAYLYLCFKKSNLTIFTLGSLLAFAYIMRPTNSLSIIGFAVLLFFTDRRFLISYLPGLFFPLGLFALINLNIYESFLPPYFAPARVGSTENLFNAFFANIISPNRGLFVFSPILILSLFGFYIGIKDSACRSFYICIGIIILLHLLVISTFPHWWGGYSYGPRFSTDMLFYLALLLLPFCRSNLKFKIPLILILLIPSLAIHYRGANHATVHRWNSSPKSVDKKPGRIWDWTDIQFLR